MNNYSLLIFKMADRKTDWIKYDNTLIFHKLQNDNLTSRVSIDISYLYKDSILFLLEKCHCYVMIIRPRIHQRAADLCEESEQCKVTMLDNVL